MRYARNILLVLGLLVLAVLSNPFPVDAQIQALNRFLGTVGGSNDNILEINGTLEFEDKVTVIDHGTATLNAVGYATVTTNLSSTVTCTLGLVSGAPADDPVMVTGLWTTGGAVLEIMAWKNISGTDPTLAASSTDAVKVGYICAGAD